MIDWNPYARPSDGPSDWAPQSVNTYAREFCSKVEKNVHCENDKKGTFSVRKKNKWGRITPNVAKTLGLDWVLVTKRRSKSKGKTK